MTAVDDAVTSLQQNKASSLPTELRAEVDKIIAALQQLQTGTPPSGAAGGDLGGNYPNPTVTATHLAAALPKAQGGTGNTTGDVTSIGGQTISSAVPGNGNVLTFSGGQWAGAAPGGGINATTTFRNMVGNETFTIADGTNYIQNTQAANQSGATWNLPANPTDGQVLWVANNSSATNNVFAFAAPGKSISVNKGAASFNMQPSSLTMFVYRASNTTWYMTQII